MPKLLSISLVCFAWNIGLTTAVAQPFPERPVRLLVGFAAGGSVDTTARVLAQKLSERWGQQLIVDNRAGAGGVIVMQIAEKAPRDGYTLMMGSATQFSIGPALEAVHKYPPLSSFTPLAKVAVAPIVIAVHPSLPVRSLKELIEYCKSRSGQISYGSSGAGTPNEIAMLLIARSGGFDITHVPYKGGSEVIVAAVAGHVPISVGSLSTALPHVKSGRLRALAITEAKRLSIAPDLPTVAESGLPGFEVSQWYGMFGPAGLPRVITEKVSAELASIVTLPDVKAKLESQGLDVAYAAPAEFSAYVKAESVRWTKLVKELGTKQKMQ